MHPPITEHPDEVRDRAMRVASQGDHSPASAEDSRRRDRTQPVPLSEDGSLVSEYGLVAVVGATIAALAIAWASNGNIFDLFSAVLDKVKVLVGA